MNDTQGHRDAAGAKGNIFHFVALLLVWRRFIVRNVLIVTLIAVIISLVLPKWYRATTSILPPRDQGFSSLLGLNAATLKSLPLPGKLGGLASSMGTYNYLAILNSRTTSEAVIRKFGLIGVYDVPDTSMERAIEELESNVTFEIRDEEYLTITVLDRDPGRAAEMANYFVEILNSVSLDLATREARNNREFIGGRLDVARRELREAEDSLRAYQEKTGVVVAPDLSSSNLDAIADLYAMKARKEIELSILEKTVSEESEAVKRLRLELSELSRKLADVPETGMESFRLYRAVAIHQKILEYLVPLYEQARIEEQKDVPVILVLDRAVPAERKFKPKRAVMVATAAGLSLLVSILVVLGASYLRSVRNLHSSDYEEMLRKISEAKGNLRLLKKG